MASYSFLSTIIFSLLLVGCGTKIKKEAGPTAPPNLTKTEKKVKQRSVPELNIELQELKAKTKGTIDKPVVSNTSTEAEKNDITVEESQEVTSNVAVSGPILSLQGENMRSQQLLSSKILHTMEVDDLWQYDKPYFYILSKVSKTLDTIKCFAPPPFPCPSGKAKTFLRVFTEDSANLMSVDLGALSQAKLLVVGDHVIVIASLEFALKDSIKILIFNKYANGDLVIKDELSFDGKLVKSSVVNQEIYITREYERDDSSYKLGSRFFLTKVGLSTGALEHLEIAGEPRDMFILDSYIYLYQEENSISSNLVSRQLLKIDRENLTLSNSLTLPSFVGSKIGKKFFLEKTNNGYLVANMAIRSNAEQAIESQLIVIKSDGNHLDIVAKFPFN